MTKTVREYVITFDVVVFLSALVLGVLSMGTLKYFHTPQIVITIIPVLIIIMYACALLYYPRLKLRLDQGGDNLYYLGFLYTLFSLSMSLYEFTASGGAEYIVSNFGIALFTTIAGLGFRVVFNQMRTDPIQTEKQARIELAQAASELKNELNQSVLEFSLFRRAMQQVIIESFEELHHKLENTLAISSEKYESLALLIANRIEFAFSEFSSVSSRLNDNSKAIASSLEDLSKRVNSIKAPEDLVESKIRPAFLALEDCISKIATAAISQQNVLNSSIKTLDIVTVSNNSIVDSFAGTINAFNMLEAMVKKSTSTISHTTSSSAASVNSFTSDISNLNNAIKQAIDKIDSGASTTSSSFDSLTTYFAAISKSLSSMLSMLDEANNRVKENIEKSNGFEK